MEIEVKKLSPKRAKDYFEFFETVAHMDNPNEDKCYCVNWVSTNHSQKPDFSSPEKRKALAEIYIDQDSLQGYLAYSGGKVVGWCNTNTKSECMECMGWKSYMTDIPVDQSKDHKIKSIYCFAIAPHMKRKGIASQLLKTIMKEAKADGFIGIEVFPLKASKDNFMAFMGPIGLYKKNGFEIVGETKRDYIMRKIF